MPKANPASAPAAAPRHRRVASPRTIVLATILACLPILAASQLLSHIRVDEFDSWLFAYFGRELAGGAELYVDVWDNKPPGIFWVNAFAGILSGNTLIGAAIATSLASAGACTVFFLLTRRLYGLGTAAIGTFLATVYLYTFYFHVGANRPSTFIAVTEIAAVLLYARALAVPDRMRGKNLALAGLVAGFGLWFKQSALAALAAMLCHQALLAVFRHQAFRRATSGAGFVLAGWAVAIAVATGLLLVTSDLGRAWNAIVSFNSDYFRPDVGSEWLPTWFGLREQIAVLALPAIVAVATLLHAVAVRLIPNEESPRCGQAGQHPAMWLPMLWIWLAAAVYLALLGPHQRLHYLGVALPPLCVLMAHGIHLFLSTGRRADGLYPPFYIVLGLVWCSYMLLPALRVQWHEMNRQYYLRFEDPGPRMAVVHAEEIRRRTGPDDRIFVWSYDPETYYRADRRPAIPFIATEKAYQLKAAGQPIMDTILTELKAARPAALVISADQVGRFENGKDDPFTYGDFGVWLKRNYALDPDCRYRDLWLRMLPGSAGRDANR